MTDTVDISLAKAMRAENNKDLRPQDVLKWALRDVEEGHEAPTRVMVLFWEDNETTFNSHYYACNIRSSEMLALLEMTKARILRDMGLT